MFKKVPLNVFILGLVSFFNDTASEMIYPIVPLFLTQVLHAPVSTIGFIEGTAEGIGSFLKFVFGFWSDRIGKRKVFVASGYGMAAISKVMIGFAGTWFLVLLARIVDRFGKGLRTSPRDALLLQSANQHNKGFIFGFHRAMDSAGAVVGPLIALYILQLLNNNMRHTFFVAFIPALIGFFLVVFLVKEKSASIQQTSAVTKKDERLSDVLSSSRIKIAWKNVNPQLKFFFFVSVIFSLGNSADTFLILRAKNLGLTTALTVLTYALYNLSQTIFATLAGQLADKIGARKVYTAGLVIFSLVYFAFATVHTSFWVWFIFPVYGIYIAFTDGVSKAYIAEFITESVSGTYFGLYQTATSIAIFFASLIGGILWSSVSPSATFYYGSATALVAFILLLLSNVVKKGE